MDSLLIVIISAYVILKSVNTYCFLFQRTVRKIRMFAADNGSIINEIKLYPNWYFYLYYLSFIRWIFFVWALFLDYKIAVAFLILFFFINMWWPTNDYRVIQIIKKNLIKRSIYEFDYENGQLMKAVGMAEIKTLRE